jgi:hypothetical protein
VATITGYLFVPKTPRGSTDTPRVMKDDEIAIVHAKNKIRKTLLGSCFIEFKDIAVQYLSSI